MLILLWMTGSSHGDHWITENSSVLGRDELEQILEVIDLCVQLSSSINKELCVIPQNRHRHHCSLRWMLDHK